MVFHNFTLSRKWPKLDQAVKILNQEIVYQVATKISKENFKVRSRERA